jgi:hypothetical protein
MVGLYRWPLKIKEEEEDEDKCVVSKYTPR